MQDLKILSPEKLSIVEIEVAIALAKVYKMSDTSGLYDFLIESLTKELDKKRKG